MLSLMRKNAFLLLALSLTFFMDGLAGFLDRYYQVILALVGINIILAVSLNLINGIAGQFSLGHAGFMAVGAYTAAAITHNLNGLQLASGGGSQQLVFFVALLLAGVLSALCGWLVGLPSLRLRGDYLAIVTLGFGEIIRVVLLNVDALGGARGFSGIPQWTTMAWIYGFVVCTLFVLSRIKYSSFGRCLMAIRDDEIAAEAIGIATTRYKVLAFSISAFFAGIAGGLFAHFYSYINPASFTFMRSFEVVIMVVLGGMGSMTGSIFAAMVLTVLPEGLRLVQSVTGTDLRMVLYAFLLILMMLTRPAGLLGNLELRALFFRWLRPKDVDSKALGS